MKYGNTHRRLHDECGKREMHSSGRGRELGCNSIGIQNLKFKAWVKTQVKDEDKDMFQKAPDRATFKARVKAWVKALLNVY